jgi:hypothetical protein
MNEIISYIKARFLNKWNFSIKETIKYVKSDENLQSLYHTLKTAISVELDNIVEADRKHLLNKSIFQILAFYNTPLFITHCRYGKAVHETAHYKKRFYGYKASIVYHFLDKKLIAVMYCIKYNNITELNDLQKLIFKQFDIDIHKGDFASLIDNQGNLIQYNTQHDLCIDVFSKPHHHVKEIHKIIKKSGIAIAPLPKDLEHNKLEFHN